MFLEPGQTIDRYIVEEALGDPASTSSFKVKHSIQGTVHVLKLLPPELADEDVRERFLRESKGLSRLKKPHLAAVTDIVLEPGVAGLVRDYMVGRDLAELLKERGTLSLEEIAEILVPILNALHQVHERGIVHRDLKPSNVFLHDAHEGVSPVLLDFGLARLTERTMRGHQNARQVPRVGTSSYMSPEQVRSEPDIDRRCDLWAAGVVVYEALVGRRAFAAANDFDTMQEVVSGSWGDEAGRADLPDDVKLPLKRCLAVSRDKRYPTARALRAALEQAVKRHRQG